MEYVKELYLFQIVQINDTTVLILNGKKKTTSEFYHFGSHETQWGPNLPRGTRGGSYNEYTL